VEPKEFCEKKLYVTFWVLETAKMIKKFLSAVNETGLKKNGVVHISPTNTGTVIRQIKIVV